MFITQVKDLITEFSEGSVLFNDTLNTFNYGYMVLDIW